jgi:hypothetical protein
MEQMTIKKAHCFFEQSGTFKNAFKHYGIDAEDYDIQNNFGETDNVVDLFAEIEKGYYGKPSIFDRIEKDDLIMAFFPCIQFCGISQMNMTLNCYQKNHGTVIGCGEYILQRSRMRQQFLELLLKMCFICIDRGIRMVFENPFSSNTFLKNGFIKPPDLIDNDRTKRGDVFSKMTAFWFFNCKPTHGSTFQPTPEDRKMRIPMHKEEYDKYGRERLATHKAKTGICDEGRSMISPDYALNFIDDFLLGGGHRKDVLQQTELL